MFSPLTLTAFTPPLSLRPIIHLHLYPLLVLTFLLITAISRLTFTQKPPTNIKVSIALAVVPALLSNLFCLDLFTLQVTSGT